jgi:hypothetical protein
VKIKILRHVQLTINEAHVVFKFSGKIHRLAAVGVRLPSNIFKRSKNGSVLKNECKHIRKAYF